MSHSYTCCDAPEIVTHEVTGDDWCTACGFNRPTIAEINAQLEYEAEAAAVIGGWRFAGTDRVFYGDPWAVPSSEEEGA